MGLFSSESKFESSVKQIPYPQQAVYDNISDLRNLEKVQDRVPEDKAVLAEWRKSPETWKQ